MAGRIGVTGEKCGSNSVKSGITADFGAVGLIESSD
jgi:hypothetical protein